MRAIVATFGEGGGRRKGRDGQTGRRADGENEDDVGAHGCAFGPTNSGWTWCRVPDVSLALCLDRLPATSPPTLAGRRDVDPGRPAPQHVVPAPNELVQMTADRPIFPTTRFGQRSTLRSGASLSCPGPMPGGSVWKPTSLGGCPIDHGRHIRPGRQRGRARRDAPGRIVSVASIAEDIEPRAHGRAPMPAVCDVELVVPA